MADTDGNRKTQVQNGKITGASDKAIEEYKKALTSDPGNVNVLYNLANQYFLKGDFENAIESYRAAISIKGDEARFHYNLGVAYYENEDVKSAISSYREALKLDPGNATYLNNLGFALEKDAQYREAVLNYRKAIELSPTYLKAHYNLGNAFMDLKDHKNAIKSYLKVVKLNPDDNLVHYNLGNAYELSGDLKKALKHYEEAFKKNPLREIQRRVEKIKDRLRELPSEKAVVEEGNRDIPEKTAEMEYSTGNICRDRDDNQGALKHYTEAIRLNSNHKWAYNAIGNVLRKTGDYERAIQNYNKAISIDPSVAMFYYNLGCVLHFDGIDSEASIEQFKKAIEIDSGYVNAHNSLGCVYLDHKRDYDAAIALFEKAISLDSNYPYAYYNLGLCHQKKDNTHRAYKNFKKAHKLRPNRKNYAGKVEELKKELGIDIPFEEPTINFGDVGGLKDIKEALKDAIIYPLKKPDLARAFGKKVGGGVILYGPPGCGKTYMARATAGECTIPLFNVGIHDLVDKWHGNTEKNIHEVFKRIKKSAPAILFLDEIDAIGGRRDTMQQRFEKMEVNQLLIEMDELKESHKDILVLTATNSPWDVDPALRRAGRFSTSIYVPIPDHSARVEIFRIHSRDIPVAKDIDFVELAKLTDGYSASDIEVICDSAATIPWKEALNTGKERDVIMDDFRLAIKGRESSLPAWFKMAQSQLASSGEKKQYKKLIDAIKEYNAKYEEVEGYR